MLQKMLNDDDVENALKMAKMRKVYATDCNFYRLIVLLCSFNGFY